jgi:Glycosyltransferase like family
MSIKFRLVCATREPQERFYTHTALGRSLALLPYPFVEVRVFASNSEGLPKLYNIALREAADDPAILVFLHDDVYIYDLYWPYHLNDALRSFDVVGLAGNKRRVPAQPAWCFLDDRWTLDDWTNLSGVVAHGTQWPPSKISYFGPPNQAVKLLDGLWIAGPSQVLLAKNITFDERFDFHFYDVDFCRQLELNGLRMGTCGISVMHESPGNFISAKWSAAYAEYLRKWRS